jgi:hypothetical protein
MKRRIAARVDLIEILAVLSIFVSLAVVVLIMLTIMGPP